MAEEQIEGAEVRFKRPKLERGEPIRNAGQFVQPDRPFAGSSPAGEQTANTQDNTITDGVDRGVKLGYQVIDDYLKQAKSMAKQFSPNNPSPNGSPRMGSLPGDMEKLADESMTYYRQFLDTWLRMVTSMGQQFLGSESGSAITDLWGMARPNQQAGQPQPQREADPQPGAWQPDPLDEPVFLTPNPIALMVQAARPVSVAYELKPGTDPGRIAVHPLRTLQPDGEQISEVAFVANGDVVSLNVSVPDSVAAGVYSGAIVDSATGSACGTVTVTVS